MTKKVYILLAVAILSCSTTIVKAQSLPLMTNAEIYDFNVGDIFETKTGGYSTPPTYTLDTIINKYYSSGMDTVFYVLNTHSYTYPGCPPPCTGSSFSSLGHISYYTHLNDTVGKGLGKKPYNLNCIDTSGYTGTWVDTTYQDPNFCNTITTEIDYMNNGPQLIDSCYTYFEPYYGYDIYGKGLGYISHYYNTCSNGFPNCESGRQLVYFKKITGSCGTYVSLTVTGISEIEFTPEQVTFYPNPSNGVFTIKGNAINNQIVELYDINGKHLLSKTISDTSEIDASFLDNGIYTLSIRSSEGIIYRKLIIVH